jgi:flavodoxin
MAEYLKSGWRLMRIINQMHMKTNSIETVKTLVTYYSQTGNTEKIAKAIFKSIKNNKHLMRISDVTDPDNYDLMFVGFPIINFEPVRQAKEFIIKYSKGKTIALFTTMSLTAVPFDEQMKKLYYLTLSNCKESAKESNLLGIFDCPGELSESTANALLESPDPMRRMFGSMRGLTVGFPNEKNMSDAEKFGVEIFDKFTVKQSDDLKPL